MNHVENERGETVVAVGAPGSVERLICEFPDTWWQRATDEQVQVFISSRPATHRTPLLNGAKGEEIGGLDLWKLGERVVSGRREYVYAHWSIPQSFPYWPEKTFFYDEQEPTA